MVSVANKRNFHIIFAELLRDFVFVINAVLEESAAFDFPTVVNATARGKASCDEWGEKFKRTKVHFIKIKMIV